MNFIYSSNDFKSRKPSHAVTCMKYLSSIISIIFLPETLTWNKITFRVSNLLNLSNIPFPIRFTTTFCRDLEAYN